MDYMRWNNGAIYWDILFIGSVHDWGVGSFYNYFSAFSTTKTTKPQPKIFGVGQGSSTEQSGSAAFILFHHFILSEVIRSVIFLIEMSFISTFINVYFGRPYLFSSPQHDQFTLSHCALIVLFSTKRLSLIFSSIGAIPIFKQISLF